MLTFRISDWLGIGTPWLTGRRVPRVAELWTRKLHEAIAKKAGADLLDEVCRIRTNFTVCYLLDEMYQIRIDP